MFGSGPLGSGGGGGGDPVLGGDLSGTASAATVEKLDGNALNSAGARTALGLGNSATHPSTDFAGAGASSSSVAPAFTSTAQIGGYACYWHAPAADGVTLWTATNKNDAQPKAPAAQPDCLRLVRIVTGGTWVSTDDVTATIVGRVDVATSYTASYVIPANTPANTTILFRSQATALPLARATTIEWDQPAGWTAGTFLVETDSALQVLPFNYYGSGTVLAIAEKAGAAGAAMADVSPLGTLYRDSLAVAGTRTLYDPATTPNGATDIVLIVRIDDAPGGSVASHAHVQAA